MSTPAIIYLVINCTGLGILMANHGKPTKTNFWASFGSWLILILPLLYWGGFFS
jgi:hypothetical protein